MQCNVKFVFTGFCITSAAFLSACDNEASSVENHSSIPFVEIIGGRADDVSIDDEEFQAIADEYGLWDVPSDEGETAFHLSNYCLIPGTVSSEKKAYGTFAGSTEPLCYGYAKFGSDTEYDCYVKFPEYGKYAYYAFVDANACMAAASLWYKGKLSAYYDTAGNVYLRMDRKWCEKSNCEDGLIMP